MLAHSTVDKPDTHRTAWRNAVENISYLHLNNCSWNVVLRVHTRNLSWTGWPFYYVCHLQFVLSAVLLLFLFFFFFNHHRWKLQSRRIWFSVHVFVSVFTVICPLVFDTLNFSQILFVFCINFSLCFFLSLQSDFAHVHTESTVSSLARTTTNSWTGIVILSQSKKGRKLHFGNWNSRRQFWQLGTPAQRYHFQSAAKRWQW